ncbi:methyl-accepting chemotaxis protein [Halalkalibacillus halophilus]|uniref:methyl-accepting chemotaxis protein n=1 Tax=Halalkalibacillus halophilus TaxID=392827 RepID=UPI0004053F18|nr:methyl-accepting chemotaxis protein [Halalkalibacillus halophilus]
MKKKLALKSVRAKILAGFLSVIFLVLTLGAFNFYAVNTINNDTDEIVNEELPLMEADEGLAFNMAQRIALARAYVLYGDEELKERFDMYTESSIAHEEYILSATNSQELQELITRSEEWEQLITEEIFVAYDNGNETVASQMLRQDAQTEAREIMDGFESVAAERRDIISQTGQDAINAGNMIMWIGLAISGLVLVLGIVIALAMANMITNPIKQVMNRMKAVSEGDLSQEPLEKKTNDEIGQLVESTNDMTEQNRQMLTKIRDVSQSVSAQSEELTQSSDEVKSGSQQIASTMQELSSGSESQANHASELSEKMGSFTEKVNIANTRGGEVYETSSQVLTQTNNGSEIMTESVQQMQAIDRIVRDAVEKVTGLDQQSQEISKLVKVIKDIAEQTNLLALNAAIEAARAGEHGKGFAVVADEVRKLAEQVGDSISDITNIVDGIQRESTAVTSALQSGYDEVEKGTASMQTTEGTFAQIKEAVQGMATNIQDVTVNLTEIANDSQEMNTAIEEIASISEESAAGVEQTSASVEESSSSMEEVSASADDLSKLAEELNQLVSQYKI